VQTVDVLRNQAEQFVLDAERLDKVVADVGFGGFVLLPAVEAALPRFNARRFAAHVFLKGHRTITRPDAAGTAEIRYAGLRADPSAGEDDDLVAPANFCGKFFQPHNETIYRTTDPPLTTKY
jgi:hypothetical protein